MVYQVLKKSAAVLALAFAASTASATLYDLGTLNSTLARSNIQISGIFDDSFTFKTGSMPGVFGTIDGIDADGDLLARYRFGVGDVASIAWDSWSHPGAVSIPSNALTGAFSFSQTVTGLDLNTSYWIQLMGSATEASYNIRLSPTAAAVSAVPEPETFILMLTGLAMIGATARRRKISRSTAGLQQ